MKRFDPAMPPPEAFPHRPLWLRTLKSGWWYLPLVHLAFPGLAGWPWARRAVPMPPALRLVGLALLTGGAALTSASVYTLVRYGQGTPAPHDPPRRFVCHGPYRLCRNPMELGNLLTLVGRTLLAGSPALAVACVLFASTVHAWVVLVEEPYLLRHFGREYHLYQESVPRWGWSPRRHRGQAARRLSAYRQSMPDAVELQAPPGLDTQSVVR